MSGAARRPHAEPLSNPARATPRAEDDRAAADTSDNVAVAQAAGLIYVDDHDPGITRAVHGDGFVYRNPAGAVVHDAATLIRIAKLAVPPAYTNVWICENPDGHVQATGRDARGRKQYRYHPHWREIRDETKFARMAAFGRALPAIRAKVDHDLGLPKLVKDKVVATVVRLLETTLIRVGNDEYAKENHSFGLTTLRRRHVEIAGAQIVFSFRGKSGVDHHTGVRDRRLSRIVRACHDLPGHRLFQFVDEDGVRHPVESADVNAWLGEAAGEHFTAKDFRTWAGTVAAAKALAIQGAPKSEREAKHAASVCIKATAGLLGNTPAVCRAAYVHPAVLAAFAEHRLPPAFAELEGEAYEAEVLSFLDALSREVEAETGPGGRGLRRRASPAFCQPSAKPT